MPLLGNISLLIQVLSPHIYVVWVLFRDAKTLCASDTLLFNFVFISGKH